ncbi:natterin-3-like [Excalfactoria chinensis]|uniref:natterin-3-like n=1 Tax=Excalfactoria chinensis TaxID=46218 RepID=UPI003B3B3B6C
MLTSKLFLAAALLFLTPNGVDGAPGRPMGRKLLHAPIWAAVRRAQGSALPSWLSWEPFSGHVPPDAVSNWNAYINTTEYICLPTSGHCSVGSYVPHLGPYCSFPYAGSGVKSFQFNLLVNKGRLEALRWVDDSFGDVPDNAVESCESMDVYVGRNRYGVGKISKEQRALFVVLDGKEIWFKWYQALTVKTGPANVTISSVTYNLSSDSSSEPNEEVTIKKMEVKNEGCRGMRVNVSLEEAVEVEQDWELEQEIFRDVYGLLEAGLLAFNGIKWEVTNVTNVTWVGKASAGEYIEHSRRVELEMRPRTACTVAMTGRRLDARIPFTATLSRDFGDGQTHWVQVTGVTRSQQMVQIRADIERCWALPASTPC